ncbi:actin-depolymerizing factor gmf1 [Elsinoe australis]|uniref:Actin-depolymerizing factor gmf1 n=1 Tax=Elsinoe australis TaxID=40998 RepID=A0A4U7B3U4_9PEZI|nr:actin-depolymerizing factor gmf1 [Elsinoe australis]
MVLLPSLQPSTVPFLTPPQSSEARLYTFSPETKAALRKFRLSTSRSNKPQARICASPSGPTSPHMQSDLMARKDQINKSTLEIYEDEDTVYTDVQELADELPDHTPRFILLSYPLTMASGRQSVPYVMLYYLPVTCNSELKMVYAGAKELVRNTAEVQRIIEVADAEEVMEIEEKLKGED